MEFSRRPNPRQYDRSCRRRPPRRRERGKTLEPLDFPDEAQYVGHELRLEPHRGSDVAVPRGTIPGCAIINADVPRRAMRDGFLTGCNEIGLAFGKALAPDGDGLAKPTAVERRHACRG